MSDEGAARLGRVAPIFVPCRADLQVRRRLSNAPTTPSLQCVWFHRMVSLVLVISLTLAAQSAAPPLPALALDAYPPVAREAIARAHRDARAQPGDAARTGALGRVLQAWEQWDAAHQAYARAQALAPRAFDWPYLDAIVLQRLARPDEAVAQLTAALAVSPDYLPARLKLAEARLDAGDLVESARLFAALTDPACQPAVQFGLGRIAAAEGRRDEAIERFQ